MHVCFLDKKIGATFVFFKYKAASWNMKHVFDHLINSLKLWTNCEYSYYRHQINGKWNCDTASIVTVTQEKSPQLTMTYWKCLFASVYIKTMTTNDVQESWRGRFEPLTLATPFWGARGHLNTWYRDKNWKWDWAPVLTSVLFSSCAERPQRNALCLQLWLVRYDRLVEMQLRRWCGHLKSHRRSVKISSMNSK